MSEIAPARIGFLVDTFRDWEHPYSDDMLPTFQMVADEFAAAGLLDRPVEFVVRAAQGLPTGSIRAVRDAFYELVEEDCLVTVGPFVSENGEPLREHIEKAAQVACISMAGTESMLREWVFALSNGSMLRGAADHGRCREVRRLPDGGHRARDVADRRGVRTLDTGCVPGVRAAHRR